MAAAGEEFDNLAGQSQAPVSDISNIIVKGYNSFFDTIKQQLKRGMKSKYENYYELRRYGYDNYFSLFETYAIQCKPRDAIEEDMEEMTITFKQNEYFVEKLLSKEISLENINTIRELAHSSDGIVELSSFMTENYPNCWTHGSYEYERYKLLGNPQSNVKSNFKKLFFDYPICMYTLLFIKTLYFYVSKKTTLPRDITQLSILDFSNEPTESVNETLATLRKLIQQHILLHKIPTLERIPKESEFFSTNRGVLIEISKNVIQANKNIIATLKQFDIDVREPKINAVLKSILFHKNWNKTVIATFGNEKVSDIETYMFGTIFSYFTQHLAKNEYKVFAERAGDNPTSIDVYPRSLFYLDLELFQVAGVDTTPAADKKVSTLRYFSFKDAIVDMLEAFAETARPNKFETFTKLPIVKQKAFYTKLFDIETGKLDIENVDKLYTKQLININTTKDVSNTELFYEKDIEEFDVNGDDIVKNTQMVTRQVLRQMIPSTSPYFVALSVKFDAYGVERGLTTGPTKQIMFYLSKMLEYMIRENKEGGIEFVIPKWLGTGDIITTQFCTFLTHYLLIDLQNETSTFKFPLPFAIIIPGLIGCLENSKCSHDTLDKLLDTFKDFVGVDDKKLFDASGNSKYDSGKVFATKEEYIMNYNKICLYLINDLFTGGKQYTYLQNEGSIEYLLDPENEFLAGVQEMYQVPKGFLDFDSIDMLYSIKGRISIDELLFKIYVTVNTQKTITSEMMINAIKFRNMVDPKYDYLLGYMKKLLTDYTDGLDEATVKSIKEDYPTQEDFLEAFLLAWTASSKLGSGEKLNYIISQQPNINISTCFNQILYPIPYGTDPDYTFKYEDFVSVILSAITGVGFGLTGGYRKSLKLKHKKVHKGRKSTRKQNKKGKAKKGKKHTRKQRK